MILELLGLGILGAIGKCAYDEAKRLMLILILAVSLTIPELYTI